MICDIATAVAAAVSDEVALTEAGTGVETSDAGNDEELATDEGLGMRKPLTDRVWFRLVLLLLLLIWLLLMLMLLLLLLLPEPALLLGELAEDDVVALDEASVCALRVLLADPSVPGAELELAVGLASCSVSSSMGCSPLQSPFLPS